MGPTWPARSGRNPAALGLAIGYIAQYGPGSHGLKDVTDIVWIAELGIHYKLGVSGLNVLLVGVDRAAVLRRGARVNLRSWAEPRLFYFLLMLAESAVLGAFLAQDLALFVAFFDLMLIPFYFLIGIVGRTRPRRATMKLVIYTLVGSLLMLAAAIATGVLARSSTASTSPSCSPSLARLPLAQGSQEWIFLFFAAAFLVKMPAFPLHGWMPDGYRAMPTEVADGLLAACSRRSAPTASCAIVLPLFPRPRRTSRR